VERFEWSGDGRYILFLAAAPRSELAVGARRAPIVVDGDDQPHQLWLVEVATGKVEPLTTGTHHIASFGWSLDADADRLFCSKQCAPDRCASD
jgi:dipeptidyl aminopeptidase/acylaminoacyl peptidase